MADTTDEENVLQVRQLMIQRRWLPKDLVKASNGVIHQQTATNLYAGTQTRIDVRTLKLLREIFGVSADVLIDPVASV